MVIIFYHSSGIMSSVLVYLVKKFFLGFHVYRVMPVCHYSDLNGFKISVFSFGVEIVRDLRFQLRSRDS